MKSLQLLRTNSGTFSPIRSPRKPPSPRPSSVHPQRAPASFSCRSSRRSMSESDMAVGLARRGSYSAAGIPQERAEEAAAVGGGMNKNDDSGGFNNGGNNYGRNGSDDHGFFLGHYYKEMIAMDPANPLLLGNYAKFLHEVERDYVTAEEFCGRAILASSAEGDGEVLSLYGKLIWETQRDQDRADSYFQQAIQASPNDCMVLGSYANFLWESEDDDDERACDSSVMVEVF